MFTQGTLLVLKTALRGLDEEMPQELTGLEKMLCDSAHRLSGTLEEFLAVRGWD